MFDLSTRDIKYLQGVGPQRAAILNKELNIYSFRDLLYYFPYKYVDRSRLYYIHEIDGNMPYIQLKGKVLSFETMGGRSPAASGRTFFRRNGYCRSGMVSGTEIHHGEI
mgnify:CR=1 FL=1